MNLDLTDAMPRWDVIRDTRGKTTKSSSIEGVLCHARQQPKFTTDEVEIGRLVGPVGGTIGFLPDGDMFPIGKSKSVQGARFNLLGVVVFTDRRAVGAMSHGDLFGFQFNTDSDGTCVLFEFPYEQVGLFELDLKSKFTGVKPIGFTLMARNPRASGLGLEVMGATALDGPGSRVRDLYPLFDRIAKAIAEHSLPHVYPDARVCIEKFLARGPYRPDERERIAQFEPEHSSGALPIVQLGDSVVTDDTQRGIDVDGPAERPEIAPKLAKFCHRCGQSFEDEERFCTGCGTERRARNSN